MDKTHTYTGEFLIRLFKDGGSVFIKGWGGITGRPIGFGGDGP